MMLKQMRVAAYCRVSTDEQTDRGTIENQVEFSESYCKINDFSLVRVYREEGVSGTVLLEERPEASQLLKDIEKDMFDMVIVYKLDRLSRSTRITLNTIDYLEKHNIKLRSMTEPFETDTPTGKFMITMLAGVADLERTTILERMQYGAERAAKNGKWLGGIVPYGYRVNQDRFLEVNEDKMPCGLSEADVVRLIYDKLANHGYSTIKTANLLNSMNIPTHYIKDNRLLVKGKRKVHTDGIWRPTRIFNLVRNTVYMGVHQYGKRTTRERKIIERQVPAIVTEEVYTKSIENMKSNKVSSTRNTKYDDFTLKGLLVCSLCGRKYHGTRSVSKKLSDGSVIYNRYYLCNGNNNIYLWHGEEGCKTRYVKADQVESIVWGRCHEVLKNPNSLSIEARKESKNYDVEIEMLKKQLLPLESEKEKVTHLYRKGFINALEVEKQFGDIEKQQKIILAEISKLKDKIKHSKKVDEKIESVKMLLSNYRKNTHGLDVHEKREIINILVEKVIVTQTIEGKRGSIVDLDITFSFN